MIIQKVYRDIISSERIIIVWSEHNRIADGKYQDRYTIYFNYDVVHEVGNKIICNNLNDAEKCVKKLRPYAEEINTMCGNCKNTKCKGTTEMVWTGCTLKDNQVKEIRA